MKPKRGYQKVLDKHTNLVHFIPKTGIRHLFDKCWCSPINDIENATVHHHYSRENHAKCPEKKK